MTGVRAAVAGETGSLKQSSRTRSVSVVVPVYTSERILPALVARLETALAAVAAEFELILVNDGSRDASGEVAAGLMQNRPWIRVLDLMRNYGQHSALLCGIRAARYPVIVTIDDDLQNPPETIGLLLDTLDDGFDVVYGSPRQERHDLWRALASRVTKLALQRALGAETAAKVSGFRAFRTELRNAFTEFRGPSVNLDVLLTWATSRFVSVPVPHEPRASGVSNYSARMLVEHAMNMLTGFTTVPLKLASMLGFGLAVFGVVLLAYVLGRYVLQGVSVPGFTFLASIIIIFSGAQLFTLGVLGEYLARMHYRLMDRPAYVVRARPAPATDAAAVPATVAPDQDEPVRHIR